MNFIHNNVSIATNHVTTYALTSGFVPLAFLHTRKNRLYLNVLAIFFGRREGFFSSLIGIEVIPGDIKVLLLLRDKKLSHFCHVTWTCISIGIV